MKKLNLEELETKEIIMYKNYYFIEIDHDSPSLTTDLTNNCLTSEELYGESKEYINTILLKLDEDYDNNVSEVVIAKIDKVWHLVFNHVTMDDYLESIKKDGLTLNRGLLSEMIGERKKAIYLFPNDTAREGALQSWMGEAYEEIAEERDMDSEDLILHAIHAVLPLATYTEWLESSDVGYEVLVKAPIPIENLYYLKEE